MIAVVQRVASASVQVDGELVSAIGPGLLVLVGVNAADTEDTARKLALRVAGLRLFEDAAGKMNLALADAGGAVLAVSQFTLYGDVRRGRRPSFAAAAPPAVAEPLFEAFCRTIEGEGLRCARGRFGAHMQVRLLNDGPVTIIVDSDALAAPRRA